MAQKLSKKHLYFEKWFQDLLAICIPVATVEEEDDSYTASCSKLTNKQSSKRASSSNNWNSSSVLWSRTEISQHSVERAKCQKRVVNIHGLCSDFAGTTAATASDEDIPGRNSGQEQDKDHGYPDAIDWSVTHDWLSDISRSIVFQVEKYRIENGGCRNVHPSNYCF